jgi:hypothetical protein
VDSFASSTPDQYYISKKFNYHFRARKHYGLHQLQLHGERKCESPENEHGYPNPSTPLSAVISDQKTTTQTSTANSSSSTVHSLPSTNAGLLNYIWERQYELDCQTDPFPGDVINFRTSTNRALTNWRNLWDNMIHKLKMDRGQWSRLGFFRNGLEYWYAAKLFLARPRRSGWQQPYDEDSNLFQVKRMLRIARIWIVRGEQKTALSKRDLRVPKLLETLKIAVPELASVRIEEAPSVAPSPRPVWKNDVKKEEKMI